MEKTGNFLLKLIFPIVSRLLCRESGHSKIDYAQNLLKMKIAKLWNCIKSTEVDGKK